MSCPAGDPVPQSSQSSRKRQRSPDPREGTVAKKKCSVGEASSSDDPGGGECTVGPPCPDGCFEEVGLENVGQIFTDFQRLHEVSKQNEYLARLIRSSDCTRYPLCWNPEGLTKTVQFTVKCQNRNVTVCALAFQSIHGIGETQLCSVLRKVSDASVAEKDRKAAEDRQAAKDRKAAEARKEADRKAEKKAAKAAERKTFKRLAQEHMNSIPAVASPYSRAKNPGRMYFPFIDSFEKLYALYIDWLLENYPNSLPNSRLGPIRLFNEAFVWHLNPPKMDTCSECDKMKLESKSRRAARDVKMCHKQKLNGVHLRNVKETHELVRKYSQDQDPKVAVISMDLQQTLPIPQTSTNLQCYKRRLWTYTVDIHDMKTRRATMHLWDETCGGPGSAEVASCLLHYIDTQVDGGVERLVVFSNGCGGQIKNWNVVATYMRLIHANRFKKIEHYFMLPGHSILPCNLDFDRMRTFLQAGDKKVYDLDHYANLMSDAQSQKPFTVVKMQRSMFKDIQVLSDMITKRGSIKSMSFKKARAFILDDSHRDSLGVLNAHSLREPYWIRAEEGNGTGSGLCFDLSSVPLPEKYPKPVRISKEKLTDIVTLMSCVEPEYRSYYVGIVQGQKDSMYVTVSSDDAEDSDMLDYVHSTYSYSLTAAQAEILEEAIVKGEVLPNDETQTSPVKEVIMLSHEEETEERPGKEEDPLYTGPESSEWTTVKPEPQQSLAPKVDAQHLSEKTQTLDGLHDSIEEISIKEEKVKDLETGRVESVISGADRTSRSSHHCPETNKLQPDSEESHQDNISDSDEEATPQLDPLAWLDFTEYGFDNIILGHKGNVLQIHTNIKNQNDASRWKNLYRINKNINLRELNPWSKCSFTKKTWCLYEDDHSFGVLKTFEGCCKMDFMIKLGFKSADNQNARDKTHPCLITIKGEHVGIEASPVEEPDVQLEEKHIDNGAPTIEKPSAHLETTEVPFNPSSGGQAESSPPVTNTATHSSAQDQPRSSSRSPASDTLHPATGASCNNLPHTPHPANDVSSNPSSAAFTASDTSCAIPSPPASPHPDSGDSDREEANDPGFLYDQASSTSSSSSGVTARPSRPHLLTGRMAARHSRARGNRAGRQRVLRGKAASKTTTVDGVEWQWTQGHDFVPDTISFDESRSGVATSEVNSDSRTVDFFKLFFTPDLIKAIVQQCNMYSSTLPHSSRLQWVDVTVDEFYTFLAMALVMGILRKETIRDYWSVDIMVETPLFLKLLSSSRFGDIMRSLHFLHVSDNLFRSTGGDTDSPTKIRQIVDHLRGKFSSIFRPYQNVCVDESVMPWHDKLPWEKHKFGLKLFVVSDCKTGYITDMMLYITDTTELRHDGSSGLPAPAVKTLMGPLLGVGHVLYCNSWCTTPELFRFLLGNNTGACGTCKQNGQGVPPLPSRRELQENEVKYITAQKCLITSFHDKRDVHVMSTVHKPVMKQSKKRDPVTGNVKQKPQAVIDYDVNMRLADPMISSVACARKLMRWYKKLFFHLLDMTMLNAHILHGQVTRKNMKLGKFIREVARLLIATHHTRASVGP